MGKGRKRWKGEIRREERGIEEGTGDQGRGGERVRGEQVTGDDGTGVMREGEGWESQEKGRVRFGQVTFF